MGKKEVAGSAKPGVRGGTAAPRVVLDTNVLVSALLFDGPPNKLMSLWLEKRIVLLISREVLVEYYRVLAYPKFKLTPEEITELIAANVLPFAETVSIGPHPPVISEDPDDDKFLFLANAGRARCIISGDKHLLSLGKYEGIEVLPVRIFLESFQ